MTSASRSDSFSRKPGSLRSARASRPRCMARPTGLSAAIADPGAKRAGQPRYCAGGRRPIGQALGRGQETRAQRDGSSAGSRSDPAEGDLSVRHSGGVRRPAPNATEPGDRGGPSRRRPIGQALGRGQETRAQRVANAGTRAGSGDPRPTRGGGTEPQTPLKFLALYEPAPSGDRGAPHRGTEPPPTENAAENPDLIAASASPRPISGTASPDRSAAARDRRPPGLPACRRRRGRRSWRG